MLQESIVGSTYIDPVLNLLLGDGIRRVEQGTDHKMQTPSPNELRSMQYQLSIGSALWLWLPNMWMLRFSHEFVCSVGKGKKLIFSLLHHPM